MGAGYFRLDLEKLKNYGLSDKTQQLLYIAKVAPKTSNLGALFKIFLSLLISPEITIKTTSHFGSRTLYDKSCLHTI